MAKGRKKALIVKNNVNKSNVIGELFFLFCEVAMFALFLAQ
jgi:hypothetical protein